MPLPETFCVYAIINHSRRELYYGLHDRDAAAAIIRGHEAGQVKETRHWFPCEPEEVELNILNLKSEVHPGVCSQLLGAKRPASGSQCTVGCTFPSQDDFSFKAVLRTHALQLRISG